LALVLAAGALVLAYYLWQQQQIANEQVVAIEGRISGLLEQVERQQRQQQGRQSQLEQWGSQQTVVQQRLVSLEEQLPLLRSHLSRQAQEWELAEVDYLLRIAEHRLQLDQDVPGAIQALRSAMATLATQPGTEYARLQQAIEQDIMTLNTLQPLDTAGLARQLDDLQALTARLVLPVEGESWFIPEAEEKSSHDGGGLWQRFLGQLKQDLQKLLVVRRQDASWQGPPAPGQLENLQWMLQLRLESARLALLAGQEAIWQESLARAQSWLEQHFKQDSETYRQMAAQIEGLSAHSLDTPWPSLLPTIHLVEELLLQAQHEIEVEERAVSAPPQPDLLEPEILEQPEPMPAPQQDAQP
jgi:uroporphyrin-3 C-methyltransferase